MMFFSRRSSYHYAEKARHSSKLSGNPSDFFFFSDTSHITYSRSEFAVLFVRADVHKVRLRGMKVSYPLLN